ncbi:YlaF family protein [Mesobacillus foraminis]|uniref:YlaF family protein n=1 Tax=Mesobacillus foraminis TaxID=279826 RepID=UPI000EF4FE3E|nr:YlaF family protein [Mesobacillus foraminis]MBT2756162.1 YlaF family protein [Mesobacillus foraminis]
MKQIKWVLLFFAIAAATCMIGIGIAIGERSFIGAAASIAALVFIMGFGFKTKKKLRERGEI